MERVILVGLSGTGKSSVARALAERLRFDIIDTDAELNALFGAPPAEVFARFGEPVFRAAERDVVRLACSRAQVVVATGGGVAADELNWPFLRPGSVIVHLTASDQVILPRLRAQIAADPSQVRPLLESDDPAASLATMRQARREYYERADLEIDTTAMSIEEVATEIIDQARLRSSAGLIPITSIGVPAGRSDLYVAAGLLERSGQLARERWPGARRVWVVSDANVHAAWGAGLERTFANAGFGVETMVVPAGESSKSMQQVDELLGWMIAGRVDRRDIVVALGGGVVGDLAGFVASIVLRGVGLFQIPTSLLAMVDSSVGGKTGVNHRLGKNLVGSFYQPHLVAADPVVLSTLPDREFRAGWAEIVKHAMIEMSATTANEPRLLARLEAMTSNARDVPALEELLRHNVLLKAAVVKADERELGPRRLLNYGHTLGHAMEASGYRYLHGEAVALGLRAAARLALRTGRTTTDVVARQDALLDEAGLPDRFEGDLEDVLEHLTRDKKAVHGRLTWILPTEQPGKVEIVDDVPAHVVSVVAEEIGATPARARSSD